jgi:glycosyltransferase involved in cell wall biosynthesis
MNSRRQVVFIGALPPPTTGMTLMTKAIVQPLALAGPIEIFDLSRGKDLSGWRWSLARNWGTFKALLRLLTRGPRPGCILYRPLNSRAGLYTDWFIVAITRLLRYQLVLHHHVYYYIDDYDWRAALLFRLAGPRATHVVHCPLMREHLLKQYPLDVPFLYVPPTVVLHDLPARETHLRREIAEGRQATRPSRLGFLGNLTFGKGLREALQLFEQLHAQDPQIRLILAGACRGAERDLLDAAVERFPHAIDYRGPVYDDQKRQFLQDVDVLLLPTQSDSWGIVLSEALSCGAPVIANDRGCIPWIVQDGCGLVVPHSSDFVSAAAQQLESWQRDPSQFGEACQAARRRSDELEAESRRLLPEFVAAVRER